MSAGGRAPTRGPLRCTFPEATDHDRYENSRNLGNDPQCLRHGVAGMLKITRKEQGQSLVEFALVLPVIIFLLLAIVEGGRIFSAYVELQSAARDGARYASINCGSDKVSEHQIPTWVSANLAPWVMTKVASLDTSSIQLGFARHGAVGGDMWVEVTLTYSLEISTPIIQNITGNPFVLQSRMAMRSE